MQAKLDAIHFDDTFYARRSDYVDFRKRLWEVHHEDDMMPALPGAPMEEEDDDDIQMTRERATYKCPLTLTWFVNPVKR